MEQVSERGITSRGKKKKVHALKRSSHLVYPIITVVLVLVLWEVSTILFNIAEYLLPAPTSILAKIMAEASVFWEHSLVTIYEIVLGFLLSVVVGIVIAILIVSSKTFESSIYPLLVASQAIPKVAIAPLFIVWIGFGVSSKVLIAFLTAFFPVVIDTVVGLRATSQEMFYLMRSMGSTRTQTFFKVVLPNALPSVFSGFKVAIALAVVGAIVGEFVASDRGLGYLLMVANGQMQTKMVFASIFVLSFIGIVMFYIVELFERVFLAKYTNNRG